LVPTRYRIFGRSANSASSTASATISGDDGFRFDSDSASSVPAGAASNPAKTCFASSMKGAPARLKRAIVPGIELAPILETIPPG